MLSPPSGNRTILSRTDRLPELAAVEVGVEATDGQQLLVRAALDDMAVPDREDQARVPDGAEGCAITTLVRPFRSAAGASCTTFSVLGARPE
jgi:hypothetical protein